MNIKKVSDIDRKKLILREMYENRTKTPASIASGLEIIETKNIQKIYRILQKLSVLKYVSCRTGEWFLAKKGLNFIEKDFLR